MGRNLWGIAFVFIGGVVGAGFATGQELWLFFGRYQSAGYIGILLSGLMLGAFGGAILGWAQQERSGEHRGLLSNLLGSKTAAIADLVLSSFLFIIVAVMEAAWGEVGWQYFRIPPIFGAIFCIILTALCLWQKKGIILISSILVPLLIALMILIGIGGLILPSQIVASGPKPALPWWLAAFFYASYNLLLVFSALCGLGPELASLEEGKQASWLAGSILTLLNLVILLALSRQAETGSLPVLALAKRLGPIFQWGYLLALFLAIFTSILAATWGLGRRLARKMPQQLAELLLLTAAWPLSRFGFAKIVASFYPLFGSLGFLLLLLLWCGSKRNRVALLWVK
jgi:uncharacterized membrane protein YkvI